MTETKKIRMGAVDWREELGITKRPSFLNVKTPTELGYRNGRNRNPESSKAQNKRRAKPKK